MRSSLGRHAHQGLVLLHQILGGLNVLRIERYTVNGTDLNALGRIEMTNTLGAFMGVNLIDVFPKIDGLIGTLRLTHITIDALTGDHQCHEPMRLL